MEGPFWGLKGWKSNCMESVLDMPMSKNCWKSSSPVGDMFWSCPFQAAALIMAMAGGFPRQHGSRLTAHGSRLSPSPWTEDPWTEEECDSPRFGTGRDGDTFVGVGAGAGAGAGAPCWAVSGQGRGLSTTLPLALFDTIGLMVRVAAIARDVVVHGLSLPLPLQDGISPGQFKVELLKQCGWLSVLGSPAVDGPLNEVSRVRWCCGCCRCCVSEFASRTMR